MARVYVSTVVNARNDRVWARVRDFNGLPNWHPAIAESRIEGGEPADKIGCVRDFRLRNGDRIRLSVKERRLTMIATRRLPEREEDGSFSDDLFPTEDAATILAGEIRPVPFGEVCHGRSLASGDRQVPKIATACPRGAGRG